MGRNSMRLFLCIYNLVILLSVILVHHQGVIDDNTYYICIVTWGLWLTIFNMWGDDNERW